jgi:hypothetical protein
MTVLKSKSTLKGTFKSFTHTTDYPKIKFNVILQHFLPTKWSKKMTY